jgi:3-oxoacyl-[acyl-carrier-protein] synthase II
MEQKKIVISDIGTISPLGTDLSMVTDSLQRPPELSHLQSFEFHEFDQPVPCRLLNDFDPVAILGKKGLRNKDKATKMLLCACELGFKSIMEEYSEEKKPGLCVGTAFGSVQSIGDFLSDSIVSSVNTVNPQAFANTVINAPTGNANIRYLARNLSSTISTGFNSGIDALIYSFDYLQQGYIDKIITGGLEEVSYYALLGFMRSGLLSTSGTIQPFAKNSVGIVMGEGSALFLLETIESAQNRGAKIHAEIAGCANGFDPAPGNNRTSDGTVFKRVVQNACKQAGISFSDIDFIASGASGNPLSDHIEATGIASVFGTDTPVTAYKAFIGECYGASGSLNVLCAISDMLNNRISGIPSNSYPTIESINIVFGIQEKEIHNVLVTSLSCDGNCSAVVIKK